MRISQRRPTLPVLWFLLKGGGLSERKGLQQPLVLCLQLRDLGEQLLDFASPHILHRF